MHCVVPGCFAHHGLEMRSAEKRDIGGPIEQDCRSNFVQATQAAQLMNVPNVVGYYTANGLGKGYYWNCESEPERRGRRLAWSRQRLSPTGYQSHIVAVNLGRWRPRLRKQRGQKSWVQIPPAPPNEPARARLLVSNMRPGGPHPLLGRLRLRTCRSCTFAVRA